MSYNDRIKILQSRVDYAYYVQRNKLLNERRVDGGYNLLPPNHQASIIQSVQVGAQNTTPEEYNAYLAAIDISVPPYAGPLIQSKNNTTDDGFPVGGSVTKDMGNENYTQELNPDSYPEFFPGMASFTDENILAGDKADGDRLIASFWDDWGNDVFDDWGYFYLYDVESGKYYFPILSPQNEDNGVITTQTFSVFGRTFTIKHGWPVQGIFKFDISVNDDKEFRFGAYGNMGSDGDEDIENFTQAYTLSSTNLTLYYQKHAESGSSNEILYSYFIPKRVAQNNELTYIFNNDGSDDNSIMSKTVTNGVLVYFAKQNDVQEWVINDLQIS